MNFWNRSLHLWQSITESKNAHLRHYIFRSLPIRQKQVFDPISNPNAVRRSHPVSPRPGPSALLPTGAAAGTAAGRCARGLLSLHQSPDALERLSARRQPGLVSAGSRHFFRPAEGPRHFQAAAALDGIFPWSDVSIETNIWSYTYNIQVHAFIWRFPACSLL